MHVTYPLPYYLDTDTQCWLEREGGEKGAHNSLMAALPVEEETRQDSIIE